MRKLFIFFAKVFNLRFFSYVVAKIIEAERLLKRQVIYLLNFEWLNTIKYFNKFYKDNKIHILDIGCRGGLQKEFHNLNIEFYGIDFNQQEIEKLKSENKDKGNDYFFLKIIKKGNFSFPHKKTKFKIIPFDQNSSDKIKLKTSQSNSYQSTEGFNEITIDNFVENYAENKINFLKIDIDSNDGEILSGAEKLLNNKCLFGIKIETHFSKINTGKDFSDIVIYLNYYGFVLHKIIPTKRVSSYLHDYFLLDRPAQNFSGSDIYGDLVFFRTLDQEYLKLLSKDEVITFCKILETYNLNGMAIEVLFKIKNKFSISEFENSINLLSKDTSQKVFPNKKLSYYEYMERVETNPDILNNK